MGYIYVIENDVNDKIYVGKTIDTLSNRFQNIAGKLLTSHRELLHFIVQWQNME